MLPGVLHERPHDRGTALPSSIVVSISACHADDPGSIPGRGDFVSHRRLLECRLLIARTSGLVVKFLVPLLRSPGFDSRLVQYCIIFVRSGFFVSCQAKIPRATSGVRTHESDDSGS